MIKIIFATILCFFIAGCSHNGIVYYNGTYTNVGFSPKTYDVGIQYYDGESISVGSRENTLVEIDYKKDNTDVNLKDKNLTISRISKVKYSVGAQITGYLVDLAKENPELATKYISEQMEQNTKYYIIVDNKLVEVSKKKYENTK